MYMRARDTQRYLFFHTYVCMCYIRTRVCMEELGKQCTIQRDSHLHWKTKSAVHYCSRGFVRPNTPVIGAVLGIAVLVAIRAIVVVIYYYLIETFYINNSGSKIPLSKARVTQSMHGVSRKVNKQQKV